MATQDRKGATKVSLDDPEIRLDVVANASLIIGARLEDILMDNNPEGDERLLRAILGDEDAKAA